MDPNVALRMKFEQVCPDCGSKDFVEDHSQGDLICTSCGLVVEAHSIDERSEWRTFSDKDKDTVDPNRVGGPTNHLLSDGGLSTTIGLTASGEKTGLHRTLQQLQARSGGADRSLLNAFREIGKMCEALALVRNIKDRACELFKQVLESKSIRGRQASAVYAAIIYIACRQEGNPRTFKEICTVVPDASKTDIGRCYKMIVNSIGDLSAVKPADIHASDFIRRFSSHLGLNQQDMKAATEIAFAACPRGGNPQLKPWDGKSALSIAAGIIYIITNLPKAAAHPPITDVATVSEVAEVTIRSSYNALHTEIAALVPSWYASAADLARLPMPPEPIR